MDPRQCCESVCEPNTVSRFVRIFPKAALFFLVLHIVIMIITVIGFANRKDTAPAVILTPPEDDLGFVKLPHQPAGDNKSKKKKNREDQEKRVDVVRLVDD
ncbi:uncharacterized protein LOC133204452 [Saccostrea echinata]|uniref:uncharacterized protein LOC133204452 n=1 Tax=Saccostrea echinata TaxID=191078 RepID=UPI002A7EC9C5|nr:uncharacterized protein LOC133204452 [Saccostrea echinata]XP_061196168.1 uncharacterized protein LOC133204452 [Saccostrea echinata]